MKRDNPGNADYSFKDMAEYSPFNSSSEAR